jgi:UDP-N-acetyl-D-galactosamine dehydrogenase
MDLYEKIKNKEEKLSVTGLGYVGLPLAISFAKKVKVVGFDINKEKIEAYKKGIDVTDEVGNKSLQETTAFLTSNKDELKKAKFHIIAVPTPINSDNTPNLDSVIEASKIVGRNLIKGSIVVYESTVYPGVTEDICRPLLEKESGLRCGFDFKIGYSPERINPGDRIHRLEKIKKVVSGMDKETLAIIAKVYGLIIEAGIYKAESIKVAEAAKVIENAQRDINIAFMNELSIIFNKLGIDTQAVLRAASTKWNFLQFTPGLVGGHCIGVDPYYLTYKAKQIGYHSQIILAGRKINDDMGKYVAENTLKQLIKADRQIKGCKVLVMGITFKENCPDIRNSKVIDIINKLKEYGIEIEVVDPLAEESEVQREYGIKLNKIEDVTDVDAVIFAVPHEKFKNISLKDLKKVYKDDKLLLIDIKGMFNRKETEDLNYLYWRL